MRFWLDTEFMEDGRVIDLLSIGMVAEDGRITYLENADADLAKANPWVVEHVFPHLSVFQGDDGVWYWNRMAATVMSHEWIRDNVLDFVGPIVGDQAPPEIWAYYADYDWVVFCQLFGTMMDLPPNWPMYCRDLKQLVDFMGNPPLFKQRAEDEHHALNDAVWTMKAWERLQSMSSGYCDEACMLRARFA